MSDQKSKEVKHLNQLISRNYDAEKGYKEAVERVSNAALKSYFVDKVEERYKFGHDLKPMIIVDGGEVEKGSSVLGDVHRQIMKIKDMVTGSDDEAIVEECLRGEKFALEDYKDAIASDEVDAANKNVLKNHLKAIEESVMKLEVLSKAL